MAVEFKDYYQLLGVKKTATEKEIRTAYRKLARELHPDLNPNNKQAEQRFKDINEAYEVLSDAEKRKKYDQLGSNWKRYEQWQRTGGGQTGQPFDFDDLFGGAGRGRARTTTGRTVTPEEMEEIFGGAAGGGGSSPFSDFFRTFFGGGVSGGTTTTRGGRTTVTTGPSVEDLFGGGGRGGSARKGRDVDQVVDVSLEEAFNGTSRVIQLTDERDGRTRRIEVKIPPGVAEGSRVRVAGQAGPGVLGGQAGDLYLVVHLTPSPSFTRDGDDLRVKVPARLTTAVLGGEVEVPTPKGGKLALKIPPETQNGRVFRLRGQGMPRLERPTERGDLFAEIQVQLPESLSDRQRELFEELAKLEA
jgi:curved DNA-binding protein